jgi:hypothetical protein
MVHWWDDSDRGVLKCLETALSQRYFVDHKSRMVCLTIELIMSQSQDTQIILIHKICTAILINKKETNETESNPIVLCKSPLWYKYSAQVAGGGGERNNCWLPTPRSE